MAWWKRVPVVERVTAGAEAVALAHKLIDADATDAEVLAELRNLRGGRRALQDAAVVFGNKPEDGYPATRIYRLLREATGDAVQAPTDEQRAVEDRQRQLWEQPVEDSFRQLAAQVPRLRQLEWRAQNDPDSFLRGLTLRESGLIGGTPPRNPRHRQVLVLMGIEKAVNYLLGPTSGTTDPVLSSANAASEAALYLRQVAGIDPSEWRK